METPILLFNSVVDDPFGLFVCILDELTIQLDSMVWCLMDIFWPIEQYSHPDSSCKILKVLTPLENTQHRQRPRALCRPAQSLEIHARRSDALLLTAQNIHAQHKTALDQTIIEVTCTPHN